MRFVLLILIMAVIAACESVSADQQAFSVTLPATEAILLTTEEPTLVATIPTRTPTLHPTATPTWTSTPTSSPTATLTHTPAPTDTPEPTLIPTIVIAYQVDHYAFARPIADGGMNMIDQTYAYGDTQFGTRRTHHGVEFVNPRGTPVLAVAGGTIVYAGTDDATVYGRDLNYYGNLVIIEHGVRSPEGLPVYTLYGHLDSIDVETGQVLEQGDRIGRVGDSGIAIGPHLHFEVRVGDPYDFGATRNPELWLYPLARSGTLAGRVTDLDGDLLEGIAIEFNALDSERIRYAFTYADDTVNSSIAWGENFTYGDLIEGEYEVRITTRNGTILYKDTFVIETNRTTFLDIQIDV